MIVNCTSLQTAFYVGYVKDLRHGFQKFAVYGRKNVVARFNLRTDDLFQITVTENFGVDF